MSRSLAALRSNMVAAIAAAAISVLALTGAAAQPASGPPNALQGFSQNRDKPVKIASASLEVRDKEKVATFSGNVHLVQGDTTLRCKNLSVFYEADVKPAAAAAQPGSPSQQQIRRIEARGDVIVTHKDQTATGDNGVFDMKANTVTLMGNVMISQGANVVKGDRLVVHMTTGVSRVECDKSSQCRVQALIQPGGAKEIRNEPGSAKGLPKSRQLNPSGLY
jgi:lipopolysaccharide export system protein LptA